MKKISYFLMLLFTVGLVSCTDDDNDTLTGSETTGGLLNSITPGVTYARGADPTSLLNARFRGFQGNDQIAQVEIYKQYTGRDAEGNVVVTNKALLKTVEFPLEDQMETINYSFNYNDLIAGLTLNGAPMPADDSSLNIGDFWTLSYVSTLTDGSKHQNRTTTRVNVACGSFLAGEYVINYTTGPQPITITSLGGGLYEASYFPTFSSVYWWRFQDVCGNLTITDWQFQGSNPISGTNSPMPTGVVNPDGSLTFTGINVAGVSWYVDRSWTIFRN